MTQELHAIVAEVIKIRKRRDKLDEDEGALWRRFYEIADDFVGEGESYIYIDSDLKLKMAREMHHRGPTIDPNKLEPLLTDEQWKLITRQVRVFDMTKLEEALAKGSVAKDAVEQATETPKPSAHKIFRAASKDDLFPSP